MGDSPSYEHLSRPYLEKMKFLDQFIQSRKSYRQVGLFTSPSQTMQAFDGNDSSKSNSSGRLDDAFQQYYQLNQFPHANLVVKSEDNMTHPLDVHKNEKQTNNNMPSSSSSLISQESPATLLSNSTTHEIEDASVSRKRRRTTSSSINEHNGSQHINTNDLNRKHENNHQQQILNNNLSDNEDQNSINNDNTSDHDQSSPNHSIPTEFLYPLYEQNTRRKAAEHLNAASSTFPNPAHFLHPFYQQTVARQFRNSEQLLGELVTSELIKMTKERKKVVQKKILEILFFDDD